MPGRRAAAWLASLLLFLLMFGWHFILRARRTHSDSPLPRFVTWLAYFSLGIWTTFIFFSLVSDAVGVAVRVVDAVGSRHVGALFVSFRGSDWLPAALFAIAMGMAGLGFGEALSGPRIEDVALPIEGLPPSLDGLQIVQLSDLHIGPLIRQGYVEDVVRKTQSLHPDLIAVTGDLADGRVSALAAQVEPLAKLHAPLGVFFVTGNHEYYSGALDWLAKVRELGMTPLVNENRVLSHGDSRLLIAGVTDPAGRCFVPEHQPDPAKAAESSEPVGVKILMSHRPDSCYAAEKLGFQVQLSGHTHGGQFFPFSLLIPLFHKYYRGLYRFHRLWLYVNPGTGYWGPPHRFLVPAEITRLTLHASA